MSVATEEVWGPGVNVGGNALTVYLDLDTVLLTIHRGRRGIELSVPGNLREGVDRLLQIADRIVVLVFPPNERTERVTTSERLHTLRSALNGEADDLIFVQCDHGIAGGCECAKPGSGLIQRAAEGHGLPKNGGWFIGADQEGVVSGRGAGLRTIRIGPEGHDHLSVVHRPDYEARDLLDAANHIMVAELA